MDGKRLKDLIEKRSTIWTIGFCMTGIIVLGSIASLERAQRSEIQQETEAVPGEQALADDLTAGHDNRMQGDMLEGSDEEQALADGADGNADDLAAANADGMADGEDGQTGADGNTDASVTANADGTADTTGTSDSPVDIIDGGSQNLPQPDSYVAWTDPNTGEEYDQYGNKMS